MGSAARERLWIVTTFVLSAALLYTSQGVRTVPIREISTAEARELFDTYRPVVLDVREKVAFDKGHIPGAVAVPVWELGQKADALGLTRAGPVLVYCGDGTNRGPDATRQLNARGYGGAVNLKGGFERWQAAGQPVAH
jgi:rhodanese-related sulfurtransferase